MTVASHHILNREGWCSFTPKTVNLPLMQEVIFQDLGSMEYKEAWDYQEQLLRGNVAVKTAVVSDTDFSTIVTDG